MISRLRRVYSWWSLGYQEDEGHVWCKLHGLKKKYLLNKQQKGTRKVITEHATIGLVITSDGSIVDIPRSNYEEAEERVIAELKEIGNHL